MYRYQTLEGIPMEQLAECFNSAFSDYEQPICFTPDALSYYLTAGAVDLSLSFGAFCREELVAFILNSGGVYQERDVVFDAGTGVVPGHRGRKVFSGLFDYTCRQLRCRGIGTCCLEVLQSNHHALAVYRKKGFSVRRGYSVLTASGPGDGRDGGAVAVAYPEFSAFPTAFSPEPSFEHTSWNIDRNPGLYEVLFLEQRAYCIFAKRNGELIQLHYNDPEALKEVLSALIRRYPSAMAKNIDSRCADVIQILKELGFVEILKQYEMARDL